MMLMCCFSVIAVSSCGKSKDRSSVSTVGLPEINPHKDLQFLNLVRDLGTQLFDLSLQSEARFIFVPLSFISGVRFDSFEDLPQDLVASQKVFEGVPFFYKVNHNLNPPQGIASHSSIRETYALIATDPPLQAKEAYIFTFETQGRKRTSFLIGVTAELRNPALADTAWIDQAFPDVDQRNKIIPMLLIKRRRPETTTWRMP